MYDSQLQQRDSQFYSSSIFVNSRVAEQFQYDACSKLTDLCQEKMDSPREITEQIIILKLNWYYPQTTTMFHYCTVLLSSRCISNPNNILYH